jgi:hypothetical protein
MTNTLGDKNDERMMTTMTLSIDVPRHLKLRKTAAVSKLSMSEITRIALDRLWVDLGKIDPDERKAMALLVWAGEGTEIPAKRGAPPKKSETVRGKKPMKSEKK